MRLTKLGHSGVRFEHGGTTVLLDPGVWTDQDHVGGVDAVLVTHEHPDHYEPGRLRAADAPIVTCAAVAAQIAADAPDLAERVTVVAPGEAFTVGGVDVRVVGGQHAVIHPELPIFENVGFVLDLGGVATYHPGDALHVVEGVDLLLLPVSAPWLKASETVDFARAVGAPRNVAIHDEVHSERGLGIVDGHLRRFLEPRGQDYVRLAVGADL